MGAVSGGDHRLLFGELGMKITIISPLGLFESAETEAVTIDEAIIQLNEMTKNGLNLLDADGVLTLVPKSMIPNSVIRVTGCKPKPKPEKRLNLAVVE